MLIVSPPDVRIDVHQHLWPPELIEALRGRGSAPRLVGEGDRPLLEMVHEPDGPIDLARHRLETRLKALDAAGIDRAVVSLSAPLGIESLPATESAELIAAYHDGMLRLVGDSDGRLTAWAAVSLTGPDCGAAVVAAALDSGFVGAMVPSEALARPEAIDRAAPLLDLLEARGAALFVHPGPAPGTPAYARDGGMPVWWPNLGVYPGLSIRAYFAWRALGAERWPRLRVCFAVMGGAGPFLEERWRTFSGEARGIDRNVFLDTASFGRLALECAMATFGVEQIVFGTDIPVISGDPPARALVGIGQAAEEAVVHTNPVTLLNLTE
jgi:predicted TIM-barrel fold metal-dependent hydrolase